MQNIICILCKLWFKSLTSYSCSGWMDLQSKRYYQSAIRYACLYNVWRMNRTTSIWADCILVQTREDLQNPNTVFHPTYTHQIYEGAVEDHRETITGYKGLQINVYHTAAGLRTFINYTFTEQQPQATDPTIPILQARKRDTSPIIRSLDEFVKVRLDSQTFWRFIKDCRRRTTHF